MKNKILLSIIVVLLPITIFTLRKQVTSDSPVSENVDDKSKNQEIYIDFLINNEKKKIPLEEYLINVVGAEVPALFDMEALKSQAVASRTFALYEENTRGYVTIADQAYNLYYYSADTDEVCKNSKGSGLSFWYTKSSGTSRPTGGDSFMLVMGGTD